MKNSYFIEEIDRVQKMVEEVSNLLDKTIEEVNQLISKINEY